jgi:hypothetical protein
MSTREVSHSTQLIQSWIFEKHRVELWNLEELHCLLTRTFESFKKASQCFEHQPEYVSHLEEAHRLWNNVTKICSDTHSLDVEDAVYAKFGCTRLKRKRANSRNGKELFSLCGETFEMANKKAQAIDYTTREFFSTTRSSFCLVSINTTNQEKRKQWVPALPNQLMGTNHLSRLLRCDPNLVHEELIILKQAVPVHPLLETPISLGQYSLSLLERNESSDWSETRHIWRIENKNTQQRSWHYAHPTTSHFLEELPLIGKKVMARMLVKAVKGQLSILIQKVTDNLVHRVKIEIICLGEECDNNKIEKLSDKLLECSFKKLNEHFSAPGLDDELLNQEQFFLQLDIDKFLSHLKADAHLQDKLLSEVSWQTELRFDPHKFAFHTNRFRPTSAGKFLQNTIDKIVHNSLYHKFLARILELIQYNGERPKTQEEETTLIEQLEQIITERLEKHIAPLRRFGEASYESIDSLRIPLRADSLFALIEEHQCAYLNFWKLKINKEPTLNVKASLVTISKLGQRVLNENCWAVSLLVKGTSIGTSIIPGGHAIICVEGVEQGKYFRLYSDLIAHTLFFNNGKVRLIDSEEITQDKWLEGTCISRTWPRTPSHVSAMITKIKQNIISPPCFNLAGQLDPERLGHNCLAWAIETCKVSKIALPNPGARLPNEYIRWLNSYFTDDALERNAEDCPDTITFQKSSILTGLWRSLFGNPSTPLELPEHQHIYSLISAVDPIPSSST